MFEIAKKRINLWEFFPNVLKFPLKHVHFPGTKNSKEMKMRIFLNSKNNSA